jgi:thiamine kinase-like enzyme
LRDLSDIVKRLEPALGQLAGEPVALDGGITNRNYRVRLGDSDYVIRRPGKDTDLLGIDRSAERLANEAAAELGIAPRVAAELDDCLVTQFIACRPVSRLELADEIEQIAAALRGFHRCAVALGTTFRVSALLSDYAAIVSARGSHLSEDYARANAAAARIEAVLVLAEECPCHNDLLAGNIIRDCGDQRMMIVDWEYAGMGDPRFDLGNLSINNQLDEAVNDRLLRAYYGESPTDSGRAALKLMRVLSDAREAAWAVLQGVVSELDFDFDGYAREHFERLRETAERPSFDEWLATAAAG